MVQRLYLGLYKFHFRFFSTPLDPLPGMDMPGCPLLHRKYNAFMHDIDRSLSVAAVPDAFRTQQNQEARDPENCVRLAAVDRNEPAAKSYVLKGELCICSGQ